MNNSIVKLEDCQLDEISGGISIDKAKAKQVAKKTTGYAIKGLCTLVFGSVGFVLSTLSAEKLKYGQKISNSVGDESSFGICLGIPTAFAGVVGWNLGSWLYKKLGLED